jgi:hypothetical protein
MKQILLFGSATLCLCLSFSPAAAPASARVATPLAIPLATQLATPLATPRVNIQHAPSDYGFGEDWCNG